MKNKKSHLHRLSDTLNGNGEEKNLKPNMAQKLSLPPRKNLKEKRGH